MFLLSGHRSNLVSTGFVAAAAICFLTASPAFADARLHPGDKVNVVVYGHPELSASGVTLDASGDISLPVAGVVEAGDMNTFQLAKRIVTQLSPYVKMPAVDVQLAEQSQTIFVSGGPGGVLSYHPGETLTSVLDQLQLPMTQRPASLQNPYDATTNVTPVQSVVTGPVDLYDSPVDYKRVSVLRNGVKIGPFDLLALRAVGKPGLTLQPEDTIQLENKPVAVTVNGNVEHPGVAYLDQGEPLTRAVDQVGGVNYVASQTNITLVRGGVSQVVSLGSPTFSGPAQNGDSVLIPRAPRVDVLGTVTKPGETYLRGDESLVSAIYYAGGPDKFANLKSVQVLHDGVKHEYNLKNLQKGHGGDNPPLVDGDVVFVPQGSTIDAAQIFGDILGFGYFITR